MGGDPPRADPKSISTGEPSLRTMMLSARRRVQEIAGVHQLERVEQRLDDLVELMLAWCRRKPFSQLLKLPPSSKWSTM